MYPLSPAEVDRFHVDGFLVLDRIVGAGDLAQLRAAYDEVLEGSVTASGDRLLGGITRQVMSPSKEHPTFGDNAAVAAVREIGGRLTGRDMARVFDMLIFKPPRHPHETPWHQDMAYSGLPMAPPGTPMRPDRLQFWIPMDDVDVETGCMHFVPGHQSDPLLEHVVASGEPDDPGRLLALADPDRQLDLGKAVSAPLPAGGCTIHDYGTPHYTSPNVTDRPRRAYIINLAPATDPDGR